MFKDVILHPAALFRVILSVWSLFISALPHGWKSFPKLPTADKSGEYTWWNDNYLRPVINISSSSPGLNPGTAHRTLHGCSRKLSEQGKWTGEDCLGQNLLRVLSSAGAAIASYLHYLEIIQILILLKKNGNHAIPFLVVFISWASNSQQLKAFKLNEKKNLVPYYEE